MNYRLLLLAQAGQPALLTDPRPITPTTRTVYVSAESLRQSLKVNPALLEQALNRAKCRESNSSASKLIQQLRKKQRFMNWLQSNDSGFLYLNRNSEDPHAFSSLAAMLVQALAGTEPAKVIHFFCPIWEDDNRSGHHWMTRKRSFGNTARTFTGLQ